MFHRGQGEICLLGPHALRVSGSQILVVQELRVLPRLPQTVETEVEIHFDHFLSWDRESKTEDGFIRCNAPINIYDHVFVIYAEIEDFHTIAYFY